MVILLISLLFIGFFYPEKMFDYIIKLPLYIVEYSWFIVPLEDLVLWFYDIIINPWYLNMFRWSLLSARGLLSLYRNILHILYDDTDYSYYYEGFVDIVIIVYSYLKNVF